MKKYMKQGLGMATLGIGLGVGASVASDMGSAEGAAAMGNMAKGMKPMGSIMGAGMVMDSLKMLKKKSEMM